MKPFKAAYSDLFGMARAAKNRLENAIADAKKEIAKQQTAASGQEAKSKKVGRPRKSLVANPVCSLVDQPNSVAIDISSV
eukprot:2360101-Prorocentrum_lima.AAC.1